MSREGPQADPADRKDGTASTRRLAGDLLAPYASPDDDLAWPEVLHLRGTGYRLGPSTRRVPAEGGP